MFEQFVLRCGSNRPDIGKPFHPPTVVGEHGLDLGLLKHDFGNPDLVGAVFLSPREVTAVGLEPLDESLPDGRMSRWVHFSPSGGGNVVDLSSPRRKPGSGKMHETGIPTFAGMTPAVKINSIRGRGVQGSRAGGTPALPLPNHHHRRTVDFVNGLRAGKWSGVSPPFAARADHDTVPGVCMGFRRSSSRNPGHFMMKTLSCFVVTAPVMAVNRNPAKGGQKPKRCRPAKTDLLFRWAGKALPTLLPQA